ncbi:GDP-L-fucose synthase family protein [Paramicrobacterium chengjingii]|uniref:GDP-L-fucose synthase n=1 Tax=Paramicrobacterium chengjingii TaxID=2769067 RepID=A0ABX6YNE4_9MICO|nr:GDP-L-fucose synthase [Microbacterium chengjingii]QPZ40326.1 GDP-L-fucose synthase [Microbacterium chengjingii]
MREKVFIAGHRGMVGSALVRRLAREPVEIVTATREQLDLTDPAQTQKFFAARNITQVYLAAAKVGGIHANNTWPADFILDNLRIQNGVIAGAHAARVQKLLFLGSSCIYPRDAEQPIAEASLLDGHLEVTNEPYAVAKIAGIKLCESVNRQYGTDFRSVMPTNLYGPGDNFDRESSHVLPSLLRKFHEAVQSGSPVVDVWGTGTPRREFMHVDDLADACVHVMAVPKDWFDAVVPPQRSHINVGTGEDISIQGLAQLIADVTGFSGSIRFDDSKPDGTPRKLLDIHLLRSLGWSPHIALPDGIRSTFNWFATTNGAYRGR